MEIAKGVDFTLKYYGLFGALVVGVILFFGWYVRFITTYFVRQMDARDSQIKEISIQFSTALDKLSLSIDREAKNQVEMSLTYKEMLSKFECFLSQNEKQYKDLLEKNINILDEIIFLKKVRLT